MTHSAILRSWLISVSPWNGGLRKNISAKMHPMDQISIFGVYWLVPNRISGDRYHRIVTSRVYTFLNVSSNGRAESKSVIWNGFDLTLWTAMKWTQFERIYLNHSFACDHNILWAKIAMEDASLMAKSDSAYDLIQIARNCSLREHKITWQTNDVCFQVHRYVFEWKHHFCWIDENIL